MFNRRHVSFLPMVAICIGAWPALAKSKKPDPKAKPAVVVQSSQERLDYIKRAEVWIRPSWINENFEFSNTLDVANGPSAGSIDKYIRASGLTCEYRSIQALGVEGTGATPKFYCALKESANGAIVTKASGAEEVLKVKYDKSNGELYAEVAGTRLLWALGFGADRMFPVANINCQKCPSNPAMPNTGSSQPMGNTVFSPVTIEKKMSGLKIEQKANQGWVMNDLNQVDPADPRRIEKLIQRDALKLLGAFIQHLDNKPDNQRLICLNDKPTPDGKCDGQTMLMFQDLGATFGGGYGMMGSIGEKTKMSYSTWAKKSVWANDSAHSVSGGGCIGNIDGGKDKDATYPEISEEGRQFLVALLEGFSKGPEGRKRVEDLFATARVELRGGGSASAWADAFMAKVREIKFPAGEGQTGFACRKRIQ